MHLFGAWWGFVRHSSATCNRLQIQWLGHRNVNEYEIHDKLLILEPKKTVLLRRRCIFPTSCCETRVYHVLQAGILSCVQCSFFELKRLEKTQFYNLLFWSWIMAHDCCKLWSCWTIICRKKRSPNGFSGLFNFTYLQTKSMLG